MNILPASTSDQGSRGLARLICREVYQLTDGSLIKWQAARALGTRLKVSADEVQAAAKYAIAQGWHEAVGNPIFSVVLKELGRALFAKKPPPSEKPKV
jgi:hypothetical protein